MKIKTQIHTLVYSHICRAVRSLSRAKTVFIQIVFKQNEPNSHSLRIFYPKKATKKQKKIFFGSFRLHYNWCTSSHVSPIPPSPPFPPRQLTSLEEDFSKSFGCDEDDVEYSKELSGYLQWLEEKVTENNADSFNEDHRGDNDNDNDNEKENIDRLADLFIANCHEKFRLEKQESIRRFQEMLARSM